MIHLAPYIVLPLLLVVGAVWLDLRTRRGYGLALLVVALLAAGIWGAISFEQALRQAPSSEEFGIGFVLAVYLLIGLAFALLLWIGALVEASAARQGWWIAGLVASAVLPGLLIVLDIALNLGARGYGYFGGVTEALLLFLPTVTVLAFSVRRIVRPARVLVGG
ncbi:MAG TPA: hypothetical protein VFU60_05565 [Ktedonobacterales bacterium]|nr:hypothetical protein [Ktedonobacterales bacterium]